MRFFNPPAVDPVTPSPELGEQLKSIPELIEQLKQLPGTFEKLNPIPEAIDKLNPIPELIEVLEPISKVCYVLIHPILIWNFIAAASFWVCASIGVIAILLYVLGYRKGLSAAGITAFAYTIIKCLDVVIA